jgi:preprotein translocase subunit SecD
VVVLSLRSGLFRSSCSSYPGVVKFPRFLCAVLLTGVVAVLAGCGSHSDGDNTSAGKSLQFRVVASQSAGTCSAAAVRSDAPESACDRAGTTTYKLGGSLGTVKPTSVRLTGGGTSQKSIILHLDKAGTGTLAAATHAALNKRMAILLDGRVLSASQVMDPIATNEVTVAFDSASTARQVHDKLHA